MPGVEHLPGMRVTSELAARWLRSLGARVDASTIRQWARRGWIRAPGGRHGCYDLIEIQEVARKRGLLPGKA